MTGKIKIIGANNRSRLEWLGKEFENCSITHQSDTLHHIKIQDNGFMIIDFEIYKSLIIQNCFIFEGFASIEGDLGRLAIEFYPQNHADNTSQPTN